MPLYLRLIILFTKKQYLSSLFDLNRVGIILNSKEINLNINAILALINKETWGNIYKPSETTIPLLNIDPVDLRNSPDYTLLYGVKVKEGYIDGVRQPVSCK